MPQFMIDWNQWWLAYWAAHPVLFWVLTTIAFAIALTRGTRRKR